VGAATIVATLDVAPSPNGDEIRRLARVADWLEVRGDRVGHVDPTWLRRRFPGPLLFSLGLNGLEASERRRRLLRASTEYDFVDISAASDLDSQILDAVPPERRVVSVPVGKGTADAELDALASVGARLYRLVTSADDAYAVLPHLVQLARGGRSDVTPYVAGAAPWQRILSARVGARLLFGSADVATVEGSVLGLRDHLLLELLADAESLYGIVGTNVSRSLSPRLHNACYRALGLRALYLPIRVLDFDRFWTGLVEAGALDALGLPLRGVTVKAPFKEDAARRGTPGSEVVRAAGAANTLVHRGHWVAETADSEVIEALRRRGIDLRGLRMAVVGCGGAGRVVAASAKRAGARVLLVNRTVDRGSAAAATLGVEFCALADLAPGAFDIVVNATPVGQAMDVTPFDVGALSPSAVLVDLVYRRGATRLASSARARGLAVIDGRDVLEIEMRRQFELMTGAAAPRDVVREIIDAYV
jgi:3-dehydroquinate dehydratase/shikimate dehydrogenase